MDVTEIPGGPHYAVAAASPEAIWLLGRTDEMVTMAEHEFPALALTRVDAATLEPARLAGLPWTLEESPPAINPAGDGPAWGDERAARSRTCNRLGPRGNAIAMSQGRPYRVSFVGGPRPARCPWPDHGDRVTAFLWQPGGGRRR